MPEPKRNMGASVRGRLLNLAKERGQPFDLLLTRYALERLLYRLYALRLTPEAGAVKGGKARIVPLHQHLIEQGFLKFVALHGAGPLFYRATAQISDDGADNKKPRYAQARQRLAAWVRSLGVTDKELSPNHAWRHTFKQIADRAGISERTSDYITGHANKSVGAAYGAPTLDDMAEALKKFPRYDV